MAIVHILLLAFKPIATPERIQEVRLDPLNMFFARADLRTNVGMQ
jgi:hypothetical protein